MRWQFLQKYRRLWGVMQGSCHLKYFPLLQLEKIRTRQVRDVCLEWILVEKKNITVHLMLIDTFFMTWFERRTIEESVMDGKDEETDQTFYLLPASQNSAAHLLSLFFMFSADFLGNMHFDKKRQFKWKIYLFIFHDGYRGYRMKARGLSRKVSCCAYFFLLFVMLQKK